jgi:hypothetical protein
MRRALGLDGKAAAPRPTAPRAPDMPPARHRHRFVSDGEVPVVVMPSRTDQPVGSRADAAAAALQAEREARQQAERALNAAQATIRDLQGKVAQLQTTLAHLTLARDETAAALQQAQEQLAVQAAAPPPAAPAVRRRGRPPKARPDNAVAVARAQTAKPVKWWVKGWRSALVE